MIETSHRTSPSAWGVALFVVLTIGSAYGSLGQDVGFVFASNDDQRTQAFARRGLAIDIMGGITHIRLEEGNRTIDTFREVAPPALVRTFDSLQVGTRLRNQVDQLLRISGDSLESIDFVLIDDAGGLRPGDTESLRFRLPDAGGSGTY